MMCAGIMAIIIAEIHVAFRLRVASYTMSATKSVAEAPNQQGIMQQTSLRDIRQSDPSSLSNR